jgi:hypothetical protein
MDYHLGTTVIINKIELRAVDGVSLKGVVIIISSENGGKKKKMREVMRR